MTLFIEFFSDCRSDLVALGSSRTNAKDTTKDLVLSEVRTARGASYRRGSVGVKLCFPEMLLSFGVAYIHTTWRRVRLRRVRPSRRFASKRRQTPHVRYTYERYVLLSGSTRICMLSDEEEDEHEAEGLAMCYG